MHIARRNRKALAAQKGKKANSSGLTADFSLKEADTVFGRPSEWTSPAADIETGGCHYHLHSLKTRPIPAVLGRLLSFGEHVHIVWLCMTITCLRRVFRGCHVGFQRGTCMSDTKVVVCRSVQC